MDLDPAAKWICLSSSIIETLQAHSASAPRSAGYIDDRVGSPIGVGPTADGIDAIVHTLTKPLGAADLIATPCARSGEMVADAARPVVDVTARWGVLDRGSGAGGVR